MSAITELEESIQTAADQTGPAVVGIGRGWRGGSGVVVRPGLVLTSAHNLRHEEATVVFSDERRETGSVAGSDADLDVALIKVDTGEITPVRWETPDTDVPLGRAVFALANPGGRGLRVTPGFVSSTSRGFRGPRGRRIAGAIEHTAPLPRGSSGGPLVDASGQLLGINTARVDPGLILAVPAGPALSQRIDAIARGEQPQSVRLGVALAPPRVARRLRQAVGLPEQPGLLIRAVERGSAAERAGLQRGDLIVSAQGQSTERVDALYEALDAATQSDGLELDILRGTEQQTVSVGLGEEEES
jgi:serine protease Do